MASGLLAGIATVISAFSSALAQTSADGWALPELVARAYDQNAGFGAEQIGVTIAEEDLRAAKGERRPSLDAVGLGEYFPVREKVLIPRSPDPNNLILQNAVVNYGVEARLPLFTSWRIRHNIRAARANVESAEWSVQEAGYELAYNLASAYYTALGLKDVVAAQQATLKSLDESLRIARLQRNVGRIAEVDLLRIETRASQAERDLVAAQNAYAKMLEVIRELANIAPSDAADLSGRLAPALPSELTIDALRSEALSERPQLVALRHEVRSREETAKAERARFGPSVHLVGGYNGVTGIDDGITSDDSRILVQLRLPLYSGGVLGAQTRKARAQASQATYRLRDAERQALAEVERAFLDLESAQSRIEAGERAATQAAESLRVERINFAQGRGASNDLLLAEEALLTAQTELAAAIAESQIASAALNLAIGEPPVPGVERAAPSGVGEYGQLD